MTALPRKYFVIVILIAFLCSPGTSIKSQSRIGNNRISGRVVSAETGEPLMLTNVFLNNTTIGTSTNPDGSFTLDRVPSGEFDIVFSILGYERQSRHISLYDSSIVTVDASLKPKPITLGRQEVIGGDVSEWKRLFTIFQEQFLGSSENAKESKLLRPETINLSVDTCTNELVASSDSTIIIENRGLGYRLYIQIEVFRYEMVKKRITYLLDAKFEPMKPKDDHELGTWMNRRHDAYSGSLRHFLKCLFEKKLEANNFFLSKGTLTKGAIKYLGQGHGKRLPEDSLHLEYFRRGVYCQFTIDESVRVDYNEPRGSYILPMSEETCFFTLKSGSIAINQYGDVVSPMGMVVYGRWFNARIADLLPHDYQPDSSSK